MTDFEKTIIGLAERVKKHEAQARHYLNTIEANVSVPNLTLGKEVDTLFYHEEKASRYLELIREVIKREVDGLARKG